MEPSFNALFNMQLANNQLNVSFTSKRCPFASHGRDCRCCRQQRWLGAFNAWADAQELKAAQRRCAAPDARVSSKVSARAPRCACLGAAAVAAGLACYHVFSPCASLAVQGTIPEIFWVSETSYKELMSL